MVNLKLLVLIYVKYKENMVKTIDFGTYLEYICILLKTL